METVSSAIAKNEEVKITTDKGQTRSTKKQDAEDKKNAAKKKENNSCSNTGHKYAEKVLPGGAGKALAGHGTFRYGTTPRNFVVPENAAVSIWSKPDIRLPDNLGRLIETGDYNKLTELYSWHPVAQERLTGAVTHLPGAGASANLPGDVKISNYTLSAPANLTIHENSITVEDPKTLSELVKPNSGHLEWAACTEFPAMH